MRHVRPQDLTPQPAVRSARDRLVDSYALCNLALFALRDTLTGSLRFGLKAAHLDLLWFAPDIMALGAFAIFCLEQIRRRNLFGALLVLSIIWSLAVSILFMNDTMFSTIASVKMVLPIFSGLMFFNRSMIERRAMRLLLLALLVAAIAGVILNPFLAYPWLGESYQSLGVVRAATKLWWHQGVARYGGLSGDSAISGAAIVFLLACLLPALPLWSGLFLSPFIIWALWLTNSKTALAVFVCLILLWPLLARAKRWAVSLRSLRITAMASFAVMLLPPMLILVFPLLSSQQLPFWLASMAERALDSWVRPFEILADVFPTGLFIGCGLGCFSYPMDYTRYADLHVPLDNFHLTTLLMLGYPFVIFILSALFRIRRCFDPGKLVLIIAFNLFGVMVQAYAPSMVTLLFGYMLSEAFASAPHHDDAQTAGREPMRPA